MVSLFEDDFQVFHRSFCVSVSLYLSGGEPFYALSHRAVERVLRGDRI